MCSTRVGRRRRQMPISLEETDRDRRREKARDQAFLGGKTDRRMSNWPKNIDACGLCTGSSAAYRYGARGNCARCHDILTRLRRVWGWNPNQPATLKGIPNDGYSGIARPITAGLNPQQFERYRDEHVRQLKSRLDLLRRREQIRRLEFPVSGLEIEEKLKQILRRMRGVRRQDADSYRHTASDIYDTFDDRQRRVLYALLEEIVEIVPERLIDVNQLWSSVYGVAHLNQQNGT
jgi:hypothetical protein